MQLTHPQCRPPAFLLLVDFYQPFIPHLSVVGLPPHAHLELSIIWNEERSLPER